MIINYMNYSAVIKLKTRLMVHKITFTNTVNCCTSLLKYHGFSPIERFSNVVSDCVQNTDVNLRTQKKWSCYS